MKAAIFSDTYPPEINGVATSARNLYRTFVAHGDKMLVVTTNHYNNEITQEGDILRIPGIEMKRLYGYRLAGFYNAGAMKIIREFDPDVIHIQTDGGVGQFGFIAANMIHASTVYTFHTMMEDYTYYATKGFILDRVAKGIVRGYVRYKSRAADEFITPSEKIREYMRNIGVDAYMNVIPTGIDFSAFAKENIDQAKVSDLRKKYALTPDTYVILSLGRVAKEKSIDLCLRGYAKYLKSQPKVKTVFLIVGGGPALEELKELAHQLNIADNVIFVGPVNPDDVPLYYSLGQAFVSASITETQGLTFMEAMASSLVLLVRYDDSLLGTIKDGENGFFFLDEDDLAAKLPGIIALSPAKSKVVKENALKGLEPYSLERFYTSVHEVYERAIKKNW
jgi:1,2-diacylglycerol 3-alpha-glucosyltransferase